MKLRKIFSIFQSTFQNDFQQSLGCPAWIFSSSVHRDFYEVIVLCAELPREIPGGAPRNRSRDAFPWIPLVIGSGGRLLLPFFYQDPLHIILQK